MEGASAYVVDYTYIGGTWIWIYTLGLLFNFCHFTDSLVARLDDLLLVRKDSMDTLYLLDLFIEGI